MKTKFHLGVLLLFWLLSQSLLQAQSEPVKQKKLVILGSSVASGWVTSYQEKYDMQDGYAGRLGRFLEPKGWEVINISIPGMDTKGTLERFNKDVVSLKPDIVFIGLSMSNEGLEREDPEKVSQSYENGIRALIDSCRKHKIIPVVGLCYANNNYTSDQYQYLKKMNVKLQSWGIPTVNLLGALDDGNGHFPKGVIFDPNHPDDIGHEALFRAFVPDFFEAVLNPPVSDNTYAEDDLVLGGDENCSTLSYIPSEPIHSLSFGFSFRSREPGILALIHTLTHPLTIKLDESGILLYQGVEKRVESPGKIRDTIWHQVFICHGYLSEQTTLYLDGKLIGSVMEQFDPTGFQLQGSEQGTSFRDLRLYRAVLSPEEIDALRHNQSVEGSLEILSPLHDRSLQSGSTVINQALSRENAVADDPQLESKKSALIQKIMEAANVRRNELIIEPKQPITLDPSLYDLYQGKYELAPGDYFTVSREGGHLYFEDRGNRAEIFPESTTKFFIRYPADLTVTFIVDEQGEVDALVFAMNGREMRAEKIKK